MTAPGVSVGTDNEVFYNGQALDESLIAVGDMPWSGFAQELLGGAIVPANKVQVIEGNKQTFTFTPEKGYVVEEILIDGLRAEPASSYTFENVQQDHDATVRFGIASGVVDPDISGVSGWLNTKDHFAYVQGYPGGFFLPNQNLTRAEAAQMSYNLLLEQNLPMTVEFADVADSAWYTEAVNALASLEIVKGSGDGVFAPERSITRAEFTAIAMWFADLATGRR